VTTPDFPPDHGRRTSGARFWLTAVAGWAVIGFGLHNLFHHHIDTRPRNLTTFVVGGVLLHDLVVAPIVLLIGIGVARAVPRRIRALVQAALIISACVAPFSFPLVRGYAHVLHNPSSLPHNYAANLAVVLGAVWTVTIAIAAFSLRRRGH
jgi:hypothetical protein